MKLFFIAQIALHQLSSDTVCAITILAQFFSTSKLMPETSVAYPILFSGFNQLDVAIPSPVLLFLFSCDTGSKLGGKRKLTTICWASQIIG